MKHAYTVDCDCKRCTREAVRRDKQSQQNFGLRLQSNGFTTRTARKGSRRPLVGSQEWAETRGDDIPDYSGDR